jgi:hypothetical protein
MVISGGRPKYGGEQMRIVTVRLKGQWNGERDWDRGVVHEQNASFISLANNEYGKEVRTYPMGNVARIEETGHW